MSYWQRKMPSLLWERGPFLSNQCDNTLHGGATPSRWLPLATDSESSNLAAAADALVAFGISYSA